MTPEPGSAGPAACACLPGRTADGHDFAEQAIAEGAAAVLATRPVGVPAVIVPDVLAAMADTAREVASRYAGTVIGITGSAGKTTTKDMLSGVLSLAGPTVATPRSFNNGIGFPVTVTQVTAETQFLVLEMGARGRGHIQALCEIAPPTIAAMLGIGSAHAGEFGSREATAEAKAEIPPVAMTLPWGVPGGEARTYGLLFTDTKGKRDWKRALVTAEVIPPRTTGSQYFAAAPDDGMHALRHAYASVLLDAGETIKALAEYLGHSDPGFTLRTYTHLMSASAARTRRAIDQTFDRTVGDPSGAVCPACALAA